MKAQLKCCEKKNVDLENQMKEEVESMRAKLEGREKENAKLENQIAGVREENRKLRENMEPERLTDIHKSEWKTALRDMLVHFKEEWSKEFSTSKEHEEKMDLLLSKLEKDKDEKFDNLMSRLPTFNVQLIGDALYQKLEGLMNRIITHEEMTEMLGMFKVEAHFESLKTKLKTYVTADVAYTELETEISHSQQNIMGLARELLRKVSVGLGNNLPVIHLSNRIDELQQHLTESNTQLARIDKDSKITQYLKMHFAEIGYGENWQEQLIELIERYKKFQADMVEQYQRVRNSVAQRLLVEIPMITSEETEPRLDLMLLFRPLEAENVNLVTTNTALQQDVQVTLSSIHERMGTLNQTDHLQNYIQSRFMDLQARLETLQLQWVERPQIEEVPEAQPNSDVMCIENGSQQALPSTAQLAIEHAPEQNEDIQTLKGVLEAVLHVTLPEDVARWESLIREEVSNLNNRYQSANTEISKYTSHLNTLKVVLEKVYDEKFSMYFDEWGAQIQDIMSKMKNTMSKMEKECESANKASNVSQNKP
nr:myosin-6-like [Parasteatoda tepidariorum]